MSATPTQLSPAASRSAAMQAEMSQYVALGPPWPPRHYDVGQPPKPIPDVPVTAVFLVLYIGFAAANMTIFQLNRRRKHKFIFSAVTFGFCMSRIVTCSMRIGASYHPHNIRLGIANGVFNRAGVLILFVINLFFTQRLIRHRHPKFGWKRPIRLIPGGAIGLSILTIVMVIIALVQSFYTLNPNTQRIDRDITLYGGTMFAVIAFLPIPLLFISHMIPSTPEERDHFGQGGYPIKGMIVIAAACLLTLGAAFRSGIAYLPPKNNMTDPRPWYDSDACFYVFYFTVEILVLIMFLVGRIDLRFHIPNGAKGPGSYSRGLVKDSTDSEVVEKLDAMKDYQTE